MIGQGQVRPRVVEALLSGRARVEWLARVIDGSSSSQPLAGTRQWPWSTPSEHCIASVLIPTVLFEYRPEVAGPGSWVAEDSAGLANGEPGRANCAPEGRVSCWR